MPYIGRDLNRGNYLKLDDISSSFNGSTQTFNLTVGGSAFTPGSAFSILVSVGGVIQEPESAYQVNNSEITFANAPTAQDSFFCIALGVALGIGVPGNGTVNGTQMAKPFNYDGFFYLNDATNRVGINSSIPSETLDIVGNTKISGVLTATTFSGPIVGNTSNSSGISTFYNLRVSNNLTVEGTTTTLDTDLTAVDRIEVGADSNTVVGVAITQSGTADILNLYDGSTEVFSVKDGGSVRIGDNASYTAGSGSDDLVIGATTGQHGLTILTGNNSSSINFADSAAVNPGAITYQHNGTNYMRFRVAGGEKLRITAEGKVGIGTTNPNATGLTVYRDDTGVGNIVNIEQDGTGDAVLGFSIKGTAAWQFGIDNSDSDKFKISYDGSGLDSSTSITLDRSGNVGIGSVTPDYPLDVEGSIGFTGQTRGMSQSASSPTYSFDGDSDTGMYRGNGVNILSFATAGNERLKIDADGAVSVLETGDNKGLRIHTNSGVSATNNELRFNTGQSDGFTFMANSDGTSSNERVRITSGGAVGIGSLIPADKLDAHGNAIFGAEGTSDAQVQIGRRYSGNRNAYIDMIGDDTYYDYGLRVIRKSGGENTESQIDHRGTGDFTISATEAAPIRFAIQGGEKLRIKADGKIGIGTTNPLSLLHVDGDVTIKDASPAIFFSDDSGVPQNPDYKIQVNTGNFVINDDTNSKTRLLIDSSGNVGIGTDDPQVQLNVVNPTSLGGTVSNRQEIARFEGNVSNKGILEFANIRLSNGADWESSAFRIQRRIDVTRMGYIDFGTGAGSGAGGDGRNIQFGSGDGTLMMHLDSEGKVGIGTSAPGAALNVYGSPAELRLQHDGNSSYSRIISDSNNELNIYTGGGPHLAMTIDDSQNVGIGTGVPGAKLHVFGSSVKLENTVGNNLTLQTHVNNGNDSTLSFQKSRGGANETIVQDNDDLGMINWQGYDGSDYEVGAHIYAEVDGTPGIGTMPARMVFSTRATSASSVTGRLVIAANGVKTVQNGNLNIKSTYIDFSGDVSTPQTAAAVFRPADNTLAFSTANKERVRITSDGNLGIGTDNPTYVLHSLEDGVVGSSENDRKYNGRFTTLAGNRLNLDIYDRRWEDTQTHGWIGTEKRIEYNVDDNTTKRMWMSFLNPSSTTADNAITFGEQEDTEWMRIDNGKIGINVDNPLTGLSIAKYGTQPVPNGNTYPYPAGNWSTVWNTSTANNTDYWCGFVGSYNVSSATVNISLSPNTFNFTTQQGIYIAGEATTTSSADFTVGRIIGGSVAGASDSAGTQRATKDELFRIKSDGKVGIGTNDPHGLFDVHASQNDANNKQYATFEEKTNGDSRQAFGLTIRSNAQSSSGLEPTAFVKLEARPPSLNGSHGGNGIIAFSPIGVTQGTYGSGHLDFYVRHAGPYTFDNDPGNTGEMTPRVRIEGGHSIPTLLIGQTSSNDDANGWTLRGGINSSSCKFTSTDVRTMLDFTSYYSTGSEQSKIYFETTGKIYARTTSIQAYSSERRTKKNIVKLNLEKAWNTLRDTPFYTFNFKDEIEGTALHHGPIVDECPEDLILPTQKEDEAGIINTVNAEKLQYRAYSALQQALKRIEQLEAEVAALKSS